jgi:ArsR family transcriptional regulator
MEIGEAVRALSALGNESRLAIFRFLVQAGPEGLAAGEIARRLDLAPNALTFHLKDLTNAGLAESRQSGRFVIYSAVFPAMAGLIGYLTENCCGGIECDIPSLSRGKPGSDSRKAARATRLPASRKTGNNTIRSSK